MAFASPRRQQLGTSMMRVTQSLDPSAKLAKLATPPRQTPRKPLPAPAALPPLKPSPIEVAPKPALLRKSSSLARIMGSVGRTIEMRFRTNRTAFRALDRDGSGKISRAELMNGLLAWNLRASEGEINKLMDALDRDGDNEVSFAEFSSAFRSPAERQLIAGDGDGPSVAVGLRHSPQREEALFMLAAPAPASIAAASPAQLRGYETALSDRIYTKYKLLRNAFRTFDEDKDGYLSQHEVLAAVRCFNLPIPYQHVVQLCQHCDRNGDGRINYEEFAAALKRKDALGN